MRSVGIEEELLLVDADSGEPRAVSGAVLASAGEDEELEKELQREQVETGTRPRTQMVDLAVEVRRWRGAASQRARAAGAEVAALATSPVEAHPSLSPDERYRRMAREYGLTVQEQLTCGCHVHVGVESDEEGVAVLDRIRPWLYPLLAMSANSPFWQGTDSGYASYRGRVWGRWPSAGPVEAFGSAERYHEQVGSMIGTGALLDEGMIYFDARLSRNYPTVEVRVADVCLDVHDTVVIAALVRGLVETAARAWRAGEPPSPVGVGLLRLAAWRASRSGLIGDLVHPVTFKPAPAETVVGALVDHVAPALSDSGDLTLVREGVEELFRRGNGADVQRAVMEETGDLGAVVQEAVRRTLA
ncbi:carboxylate--amine ligase [Streptomyces carminius]|uniref:Putative glutamate--cysteine ligase 2 n=1 Tax=Streptomyces carminius TaxID=2665496 RepID=A0A2M8M1A1_9ACTN|nr:glutamate--cysteine ligase [Streptomyces carminius]PJE97983.1 carboxylate--amine ligase [Streptomyces carminius]PJF01809.1 carboxylate--amine ligase [Streptomyces carminius]